MRHRGALQGVLRVARDLTGRSEEHLIELLSAQLLVTRDGAQLVGDMVRGALSTELAHEKMRDLEHQGDEARRQLIDELHRVLTSPIDSEDLFRLSRSIDDVLDNLRDFVREADLYRLAELSFAAALVDALYEGLESLEKAVAFLSKRLEQSREGVLAARKAAGQVRRSYQKALAEVFEMPLDATMLKHRELLRRLDVVGLRLGESADVLADAVLKRTR